MQLDGAHESEGSGSTRHFSEISRDYFVTSGPRKHVAVCFTFDTMSPVQKKPRNSAESLKCVVSTTDNGQKLNNLLAWLQLCGTKGLQDGRFEFLSSNGQCGGSLGAFAAKDFEVGEVLFAIPLTCIVSLSDTVNSRVTVLVREAATAFGETTLVTSELLIWLLLSPSC